MWLLFCLLTSSLCAMGSSSPEKALICGICRSTESAVPNTIKNIEALGKQFADYAVIIYENNSKDQTPALLKEWAKTNPRVRIISEYLTKKRLPSSRTEKIARARNQVLNAASQPKYRDYKFLVMADLDFQCAWPVDEIVSTTLSHQDWDCVSANGVSRDGRYYDLYAYRSDRFLLSYELLGFGNSIDLVLKGDSWHPVYSAFGGLAIYKTQVLTQFRYSGKVTKELEDYYRSIFINLTPKHSAVQHYLSLHKWPLETPLDTLPIMFKKNSPSEHPKDYPSITCCEHLTLHASMALHGFGKFYVNPKMVMRYRH